MFRGLFGGGGGDEPPPPAEHPWELKPGDFLKLGFTAPEGLSAEELQITGVHALDLGPHQVRRVLEAETGSGDRYRLWKGDSGEVAFAREILRPVVERLFDMDEFGPIFDPDDPPNHVVNRQVEPSGLDGWTTAVYRQEAAQEAYVHHVDPIDTKIGSELNDDAEGLDFYRLVGDRRKFALEAYVLDGGQTEVFVIAYLSASAVEEMWQG